MVNAGEWRPINPHKLGSGFNKINHVITLAHGRVTQIQLIKSQVIYIHTSWANNNKINNGHSVSYVPDIYKIYWKLGLDRWDHDSPCPMVPHLSINPLIQLLINNKKITLGMTLTSLWANHI